MNKSLYPDVIKPDGEALVNCIKRQGTPERVHFIELFLDDEVQQAICARFGLLDDLQETDPFFEQKKQVRLQRFLGYDYVSCSLEGMEMQFHETLTPDTAALSRTAGRSYMEEGKGPITNWQQFEQYPWPDPRQATSRALEWYEKNLPDDMCVIAFRGFGHFAEHLSWLMGYETLCLALYDQRDLVRAISDKSIEIAQAVLEQILQFERVKIVWGSDDMGFKTGTLIGPDDLREFVLPGHKLMARMSHAAGRPYLLHSCGNLKEIMADLIEDVGIDAKHSFEDTIENVADAKKAYGSQIALLGGIDVDFLCRADEQQIRRRVRQTLQACQNGGGFCLGTGNTVANYIPVENYLTMMDEGARYKT
jgi:uroporphyrinogen decarboxylase